MALNPRSVRLATAEDASSFAGQVRRNRQGRSMQRGEAAVGPIGRSRREHIAASEAHQRSRSRQSARQPPRVVLDRSVSRGVNRTWHGRAGNTDGTHGGQRSGRVRPNRSHDSPARMAAAGRSRASSAAGRSGISGATPQQGEERRGDALIPTEEHFAFWVGIDMRIAEYVLLAALESIGGDEELTTNKMALIPPDLFGECIRAARVPTDSGPQPLSAVLIGELLGWFQACCSFSATGPPATADRAQHSSPAGAVVAKAKKMSEVLAQADDDSFVPMAKDELREARLVYKQACSRHPADEDRPTDDQISALRARLNSGVAPAVDFAIYGPHGRRLMKDRKFKAQVRKTFQHIFQSWKDGGPASCVITNSPPIHTWALNLRSFMSRHPMRTVYSEVNGRCFTRVEPRPQSRYMVVSWVIIVCWVAAASLLVNKHCLPQLFLGHRDEGVVVRLSQ